MQPRSRFSIGANVDTAGERADPMVTMHKDVRYAHGIFRVSWTLVWTIALTRTSLASIGSRADSALFTYKFHRNLEQRPGMLSFLHLTCRNITRVNQPQR